MTRESEKELITRQTAEHYVARIARLRRLRSVSEGYIDSVASSSLNALLEERGQHQRDLKKYISTPEPIYEV